MQQIVGFVGVREREELRGLAQVEVAVAAEGSRSAVDFPRVILSFSGGILAGSSHPLSRLHKHSGPNGALSTEKKRFSLNETE